MKRILSLLLAFTIMLSILGCQGNFGSLNLQDAVAIPESGVIEKDILEQVKSQNAIGVFTGKSGDFSYEWTIFGSDITQTKDMNLGVQINRNEDGNVQINLAQTETFGFSALLSIYLTDVWQAQSATAYAEGNAFASVSVTSGKQTILNLTLDGTKPTFEIRPDSLPEEDIPATDPTEPADTTVPTEGSSQAGKDKYLTDPVPEGKPKPVEPEEQNVDKKKKYTCTFAIDCATILNNLDMLDPSKLEMVPSNGVILKKTKVTFYEGESVFDVLQRLCKEKSIHMEAEWTPIYNSAYVEGIHNLYEFDCGALSGWMYKVNGWYPNYGCSRYQLKDGDVVQWRYTCDLGKDVGGEYAIGG